MVQPENKSVLQIAKKLAATIGADFFCSIAKHLSEALAADCVIIGEFIGGRDERCRTVAAWMDGQPAEFDYLLAESATTSVALGEPTFCRSDVQTLFPEDTLLKFVRAEACIGLPLKNKAGNPIGVLMALYRRPITNRQFPKKLLESFAGRASFELFRKQEEDKLRESEQRYRAFIARNADAMWRVEFHSPIPIDLPEEEQYDRIYNLGYIAECNDALARLLGRESADQLIGCGLDEIAPVSDPSARNATLVAIRCGYKLTTVETNPIDAQGKRRHLLRSQWGIIEDGKLERIWGSNRDITNVRHAETALDASEQRMADLLEAVHLFVIIIDRSGAIAFCNRYFYHLLDWTPANVIGKQFIDEMIPEDERLHVQSELANSENPGAAIHFDSTLLGSDGRRRNVSWDGVMLTGGQESSAARLIIGKDLTYA